MGNIKIHLLLSSGKLDKFSKDIDKSPYNAVLTSRRKPILNRLMELRREGKWEVIHIDKYSAVFIRK